MARGQVRVASFAGGEITPKLDFRSDLERYQISCRLLGNFIVLPEGGITKRPGTRFINELMSSATRGRLVPFEYGVEQAYMIELGDQKARFYRDKGQIVVDAPGASITGDSSTFTGSAGSWTDASSGGGAASHDATLGALKLDPGASGVAIARLSIATTAVGVPHVILARTIKTMYAAGRPIQFTVQSGGTLNEAGGRRRIHESGWHAFTVTPSASPFVIEFSLAGNGASGYVAWIDDVSVHPAGPMEIPTPWSASDLRALKWTQSRDVIFFFHNVRGWYRLDRYGHTGWSFKKVINRDGPYQAVNTTSTTVQSSADTGNAVTLTAADDIFSAGMVGAPFRLKKSGGDWGWAIITGFTSAKQVTAQIVEGAFGTTAVKEWRLPRWHDDAGWPACGGFFDNRIYVNGSRADPQRIIGSCVGDFDRFAPSGFNGTVTDSDCIDLSLGSDQVNEVRWISSTKALLIGTSGAEFRIGKSGEPEPIVPDNAPSRRENKRGSADLMPLVIGNAVVFVQRQKRRLREMIYDFEIDGWKAANLTRFAEHIGRLADGFAGLAYQQEPWSLIWAYGENGQLFSCAYERDEEMLAWKRHPLVNGAVEDIAVIPGEASDEVWLMVRREIDGETRRYLEVLERPFEEEADLDDAWHVDCALALDNRIEATLQPGTGATEAGTAGVAFTAGSAVFAASDIGREIHYDYDETIEDPRTGVTTTRRQKAVAEITGYADPQHVTATVVRAFPSLDTIQAGGWRLTVTEVSGFEHLEGQEIALLGDGVRLPRQVVQGGRVELDRPVSKLIGGLPIPSVLIPARFDIAVEGGPSVGERQRIGNLILSLYQSLGGAIGPVGETVGEAVDLTYRSAGDDLAGRLEPFTGFLPFSFEGDHEADAGFRLFHDAPTPFTLRGFSAKLNINPT